jgi:hypothetical protein
VTVLVLGVVQLTLALHVRTLLTDAAAEGARYAALHGSDLDAGEERTAALIDMTLPQSYRQHIDAGYDSYGGLPVVTMTVSAPIPVLGLLGPAGTIVVTGRAVQE